MKCIYTFIFICMLSGCCLVDETVTDYVSATVFHASCTEPSGGAINQQWCVANPASLLPEYVWSSGATTEDVTGLAPNYPVGYTCKITYQAALNMHGNMPLQRYEIGYRVLWGQTSLMQYDNNTDKLSRTPSMMGQFGYACSENILNQNSMGYVEFVVRVDDPFASTISCVGFNELTCPNVPLGGAGFDGFVFTTFSGQMRYSVLRNGVVINAGGSKVFSDKDTFRIVYGNGIRYMKNNSIIPVIPQGGSLQIFTHPALRVQCMTNNIALSFSNVTTSFACSQLSEFYAELSKELDGSCYSMTNTVKFKYREKYDDAVVDYKIYDWQRNVVMSSSITPVSTTNRSDINFHTILAQGKLSSDEVYTLEVKNDKAEIYKMRFRYNRATAVTEHFSHGPINPINPTFPTGPPVYTGPTNVNPTTTVSTHMISGFDPVIGIINSMDYE